MKCFALSLSLVSVLAGAGCGGKAAPAASASAEPAAAAVEEEACTISPPSYSEELEGFEMHSEGAWAKLIPLVSTLADVRKWMGEPSEARDLAEATATYPGDAQAKRPVLTYNLDSGWTAHVYLVSSIEAVSNRFPPEYQDKVYAVELVPQSIINLGELDPPFEGKDIDAETGAWTEFRVSSGLEYHVYRDSPNNAGGRQSGDLNRVVYGPSDEAVDCTRGNSLGE